MTGDVTVVEDGADQGSPESPPGGPSWVWLVVGLAIGLGLALVFSLANSATPEVVETPVSFPDLDQPEAEEFLPLTTIPAPEGVGEVVDGFPDTLLAVTQQAGGNLGLLTWPVAGLPSEVPLPGFGPADVAFDRSGRVVAIGSDFTNSPGALLSFGTPPRVQPTAVGVNGFAWHDTDGGRLAYTAVDGDEWTLWTTNTARTTELVTKGAGNAATVVGWGEWGFAIQDGDQINLLAMDGSVSATLQGRILDTDPPWLVVVSDRTVRIIDIGGREVLREVEVDALGEAISGLMAPDGSKVAVMGSRGHMILPLSLGVSPTFENATTGSAELSWSSDSRFLVSPWFSGVLFIDTIGPGEPIAALPRRSVISVTTIPLRGG